MSIFDRTVEFESRPAGFPSAGLPDSPALEMELAAAARAEMDATFGYGEVPTDEQIERMAEAHRMRLTYDAGGQGDEPEPPASGALFPEVSTWSDDQLVIAIDLCERRDPGLNLHAVGNIPDRHEAFLDACSAELVRRLEARGVRFAA